jgi:hypothetical protein
VHRQQHESVLGCSLLLGCLASRMGAVQQPTAFLPPCSKLSPDTVICCHRHNQHSKLGLLGSIANTTHVAHEVPPLPSISATLHASIRGQGLLESDTGTFLAGGRALGIPCNVPYPGGLGAFRRAFAGPKTLGNRALWASRRGWAFKLGPSCQCPRGWGIWGGLVKKVGVTLSSNLCPKSEMSMQRRPSPHLSTRCRRRPNC